jgi:uncharacterized protein (TIGR03437 family)
MQMSWKSGFAATLLAVPAIVLPAAALQAQPASIVNTSQPFSESAAFDAAGNQYYFGSRGAATAGAVQTANGGGTCLFSNGFFSFPGPCTDAFVAKADPSGKLVFATFLGGETGDQAVAVASDASGNVYLAGSTGGKFPTTAKSASPASDTARVFAAKLSPDGARLLYSTYLPGAMATASAIAVDSQGSAYVAGASTSGHALVVKLSPDGSAFLYTAALGGSGQDSATAILAGEAGTVTVAGYTGSPDFPVSPRAYQTRLKGARNVFLAGLDSKGAIAFATYLGGSGSDSPAALQTDAAGNLYVAGETTSPDFPSTPGSFEPSPVVPLWNQAGPGGFAARLNAGASALDWSTYIMSADHGSSRGVTHLAVTAAGDTFLAGAAGAGFPVTPSAPQPCFGGTLSNGPSSFSGNVFVARLDSRGALRDATYAGEHSSAAALSVDADGAVRLIRREGNDIVSRIRFGGSGTAAPACLTQDVVNSATLSGGSAPAVTPGEFVTLSGFGIGPETGVTYQPGPRGEVPLSLGGVEVLFDGRPAPLLYVQSHQINALAPLELAGQEQTTIEVRFNQSSIGSVAASLAPVGIPGIFRLRPGVSPQAAALNQDGSVNGPDNPAPRGSVVSLWGTGFGPIDPECATGRLNAPAPAPLAGGFSVSVFDGQAPPSGDVLGQAMPALYAGGAPSLLCGIVQINLRVPDYAAPGTYRFFPWSLMKRPAGDSLISFGNTSAAIQVK